MLMKKIGIDVSEHQEEINWEEVKGQIDFAILRLGWIGNKDNHTLDKYFERNYAECKRLGIPVGVYVYSYCVTIGSIYSAINWTKEKIKGKTFEYPLFIDLEDSQLKELNKETMTTLALKFCQSFNEVKTGVYANKDWFINKINVSRLNGYKIWLAEWNNQENHTAPFLVNLWQFTNSGKIYGISGNVDKNYCLDCEEKSETEITGKKTNEEIAEEVILRKMEKWRRKKNIINKCWI